MGNPQPPEDQESARGEEEVDEVEVDPAEQPSDSAGDGEKPQGKWGG